MGFWRGISFDFTSWAREGGIEVVRALRGRSGFFAALRMTAKKGRGRGEGQYGGPFAALRMAAKAKAKAKASATASAKANAGVLSLRSG